MRSSRARSAVLLRHPVNLALQAEAPLGARVADRVTEFLGSWRFLVLQTVLVVIWIAGNIVLLFHFDPYPFILLNLAFSTQAAYAAPLILLAQNRQEGRDRAQSERDRFVAERTQSETEFLAREIASVRLMLADVVTGEELRDQLAELSSTIQALSSRLAVGPDDHER